MSDEERERFDRAYSRWLMVDGATCWERDVIRACKELLWAQWRRQTEGTADDLGPRYQTRNQGSP